MAAVRHEQTRPERELGAALLRHGLVLETNVRVLPGSPDLVVAANRLAIFVHGCFWHRHAGCARASVPTANREYWVAKFRANVERDTRKSEMLAAIDWSVETAWECEISADVEQVADRIRSIAVR